MAVDVHPTPPHAGKVGNFLQQSTAGLPNWAWILVIGAGIAAAIIVPRFLNKSVPASPSGDMSGLGLAIDPTTGLPYAVEGLVPSGGTVGGSSNGAPPPLPGSPPSGGSGTKSAFTRDLQPGAAPPNTIPIWKTPNVNWSETAGGIPVNTQVQIGNPVQTGNQTFYPITYNGVNGFIGSWDLAGIPTNARQVSWPYAGGTSGR